nr:RNA-directed DNA polymerase, eukaryota, reverse transcriptase zinc-binding domain protein [Tanacetum cinerariifolium]
MEWVFGAVTDVIFGSLEVLASFSKGAANGSPPVVIFTSHVECTSHLFKENGPKENELTPAIVLDDECLNSKDMSLSLLGRVKEFASLSNLKSTLINEGFVDITIHYMGELWVLLEFNSENSKCLFHENVGVKSWFSKLTQASNDFITECRIVWVEIEGISFKLWSSNTFKRIASKWGDLLDTDDQEDKCFHSKRMCIHTKVATNIFETSKIIFRGKVFWIRAKEVPGWVPDFLEEYDEEDLSDDGSRDVDSKKKNLETYGDDNDLEEVQETVFEEKGESNHNVDENSSGLKEYHSEDPFGFTPNEESDTLDVNKEDNSSFSGGILCVWDCNSFRKVNVTVLDSFILIRGVWLKTGNDLLIVAVYAPHDLREKRRLWDYLIHVIQKWHGEVVIMGDINEVRFKSDRFGSVFNSQGANAFNSFIANAGLEEIPLGGSAFTWCHKSATKISKLDRFLISENLLSTCPNITAVTLDSYLSNHRPILLRESQFDYGPIPFRIFDKPANKRGQVDMMFPNSISLEQQSDLELEISKEELKKAVWDCSNEKSPSPDGFTFGFYRRFWKIIESDVFEAVKQFFTLANRLVGVLGDIVDKVQSAFIVDKQILDGPFILNETYNGAN